MITSLIITFSLLDIIPAFDKATTENRGDVNSQVMENFFAAGYNEANLTYVTIIIGDKIITN